MNTLSMARRIPDEVRSQRLLTDDDPIGIAEAVSTNANMQLLFAVWYEFVEPYAVGQDIECPVCLGRICRNFKAIKPDLITLEKQHNLLKSFKPTK